MESSSSAESTEDETNKLPSQSIAPNPSVPSNPNVSRRAITSYGIILYTIHSNSYKFLLAESRDSYAFMEFIKDKLTDYAQTIPLMTDDERSRCLSSFKNNDFKSLWDDTFVNHKTKMYKSEFKRCNNSFFENMKKYITVFNAATHLRSNAQWTFFKGRKNFSEDNLTCATREFEEESTISKDKIQILNLDPFEEIYLGTDNKVYRSVYYLAFIETEPKIHYKYTPHNLRKKRVSDEVNSVMWCTFPTAVKKLSEGISGWKEKIEVLKNVFASLIKNGKRREGKRHSV
jgi:hypothetical protein